MRTLALTVFFAIAALGQSDCGGGEGDGGGNSRFEASGQTIVDLHTGLEWEKKDSVGGGANYANPHDVDNNAYSWSRSGTAPDGTAFTDFLAKLNGSAGACYAGHCDWRLPTREELEGIIIAYPNCSTSPCVVDSAFLPDASCDYWSATTQVNFPERAWFVGTGDGRIGSDQKIDDDELCVRAVRYGSQ